MECELHWYTCYYNRLSVCNHVSGKLWHFINGQSLFTEVDLSIYSTPPPFYRHLWMNNFFSLFDKLYMLYICNKKTFAQGCIHLQIDINMISFKYLHILCWNNFVVACVSVSTGTCMQYVNRTLVPFAYKFLNVDKQMCVSVLFNHLYKHWHICTGIIAVVNSILEWGLTFVNRHLSFAIGDCVLHKSNNGCCRKKLCYW